MGRLQRQVRLTLFIFDLDLFTLLASDVGGRAGAGGIYAGRGVANRAAESGIHRECGTTGRHRFIFLIQYQQIVEQPTRGSEPSFFLYLISSSALKVNMKGFALP